MWIVRWSLIGAIILALISMLVITTNTIGVSIFGSRSVEIPIYLLLYFFFALGIILGAANHDVSNILELHLSRKELREFKKERAWSHKELMQLKEEINWYKDELWKLGSDPNLIKSLKCKEKADKQKPDDENQRLLKVEQINSKSEDLDDPDEKYMRIAELASSAIKNVSSPKPVIEQRIIPVTDKVVEIASPETPSENDNNELTSTEVNDESKGKFELKNKSDREDNKRTQGVTETNEET
ncbi:hypothetical protein K9N50_06335 [bacterium]|nr:hypothetical protein [bacterium]